MRARPRPSTLSAVVLICALTLAVSVAAAFDAAVDQAPRPAGDGAVLTPTIAARDGAASVRVIDGDTLDLDGERIRLFGVDAPEGGQTCASGAPGPAATAALEALVHGRHLRCDGDGRDRYGRRIAVCVADGEDVGAALVRAGWAWNYQRYAGDRYAAEERDARDSRRGVWAMGCDSPWAWRRERTRPTQPAR
jgi:endonuclease YncB( thermonuclease family)